MKLSFVKKLWNSHFSFPFLRNGLLEIPIDLASCRKPRRPYSIVSLPTSQVGAVEVEVFLSSQGS
jgi:hypothetical protein